MLDMDVLNPELTMVLPRMTRQGRIYTPYSKILPNRVTVAVMAIFGLAALVGIVIWYHQIDSIVSVIPFLHHHTPTEIVQFSHHDWK